MTDPRLPRFTTQVRSSNGATLIGYRGIPSAYTGSDAQFQYQPSNLNIALVTAPTVSVIMTYAEVEFIRAEAVLKGYAAGDAKAAYDRGVRAAIEQWGAVLPATYGTMQPLLTASLAAVVLGQVCHRPHPKPYLHSAHPPIVAPSSILRDAFDSEYCLITA